MNNTNTPTAISEDLRKQIEQEAAKYARFNYNHDVVEGAEYRGYIAGATKYA